MRFFGMTLHTAEDGTGSGVQAELRYNPGDLSAIWAGDAVWWGNETSARQELSMPDDDLIHDLVVRLAARVVQRAEGDLDSLADVIEVL